MNERGSDKKQLIIDLAPNKHQETAIKVHQILNNNNMNNSRRYNYGGTPDRLTT